MNRVAGAFTLVAITGGIAEDAAKGGQHTFQSALAVTIAVLADTRAPAPGALHDEGFVIVILPIVVIAAVIIVDVAVIRVIVIRHRFILSPGLLIDGPDRRDNKNQRDHLLHK